MFIVAEPKNPPAQLRGADRFSSGNDQVPPLLLTALEVFLLQGL